MKKNTFETLIGGLVIVVAILFLFMLSKLSDSKQKMASGYNIITEFDNINGINVGSDIKISGVKVGNIEDISLDKVNYKAIITLKLVEDILIPIDSIFKISTNGIIGSKFINIKIGAEEEYFKNAEKAEFTESSMDLEDLISRFIFNSNEK